jgi:hypothetical protein
MVTRRSAGKLQADSDNRSDLIMTDPTETTGLLGASEENGERVLLDGASGGWDGLADFDGLPWWRRPSVSRQPQFLSWTVCRF